MIKTLCFLFVASFASYSSSSANNQEDSQILEKNTISSSQKKLFVLTSTKTLQALIQKIAGDLLKIESLIKAKQDPHYLSAKPSYMLKANKADLLVLNGLDLEVGWLPNVIKGSRNPKIQKGKPAYLDVSDFIKPLSVVETKVDRFFGDIHPLGNPHFLLDPIKAIKVSKAIADKLSEMDSSNQSLYKKNQEEFEKNIFNKVKEWKQRIEQSKIKKIVSYHSSFEYFLERFNLQLVGLIEEKPGIPPSSKHVLQLVKKMKEEQVVCVLYSSFYQTKWTKKVKDMTKAQVYSVAVEVGALETVKNYTMLIEEIVQAIESCKQVK
ncbi:MAG: metal ABC transporter substrate-binding protein [Bdellovibrionaceae bacterium]|nr:metal ABC transporter substrate-binding protein [Pseudobdellovibrionaceae bacterium]